MRGYDCGGASKSNAGANMGGEKCAVAPLLAAWTTSHCSCCGDAMSSAALSVLATVSTECGTRTDAAANAAAATPTCARGQNSQLAAACESLSTVFPSEWVDRHFATASTSTLLSPEPRSSPVAEDGSGLLRWLSFAADEVSRASRTSEPAYAWAPDTSASSDPTELGAENPAAAAADATAPTVTVSVRFFLLRAAAFDTMHQHTNKQNIKNVKLLTVAEAIRSVSSGGEPPKVTGRLRVLADSDALRLAVADCDDENVVKTRC